MSTLPKRKLGRTGMEVTVLGYGAMELRPKTMTDAQGAAVLNAVLDAGVNFVDTSIDYGQSEALIGKSIAKRRSEYYLASKCGCPLDWEPTPEQPRPGPHTYTREHIVRGLEQSLRRLKTDYLDLLQVHISPSRAELEKEDVAGTLAMLKQQGKVRWIGMSGILPHLVDHVAMGIFDAFQIPYSAFQRDHEDILSAASKTGAGIIVRGGVARGTPVDSSRDNYRITGSAVRDQWQAAKLDELLEGMSRMEFTLRFTLSHPDLDTTIVGTSNVDHLRANAAAASKGPLPADVYEEAKRRLAAAGSRPES